MSGPAPTRPSPNNPAAALVAIIRKPTTKGPSAAFQPAQSHQPAAISKQRRQHNRQGPWLMPPTENHPVTRADDLLLLERRLLPPNSSLAKLFGVAVAAVQEHNRHLPGCRGKSWK
ncbi:hypothetical protein ACKVWC_006639 [Pyricularia oryzae]